MNLAAMLALLAVMTFSIAAQASPLSLNGSPSQFRLMDSTESNLNEGKKGIMVVTVKGSLADSAKSTPSERGEIPRTSYLLLTHWQTVELVEAYQYGGYRLAAIILQESSACEVVHSPIDPLACGCAGVHADTADYVVGSKVSCAFMNIDWDFSIRVGELYLQRCTELFGRAGGIACYNLGIPKARTLTQYQLTHSPYLRIIERRIRELQTLPLDTQ